VPGKRVTIGCNPNSSPYYTILHYSISFR
jgi:hypothetical protein